MILKKAQILIILVVFNFLSASILFSVNREETANNAFYLGGCVFFRTSDNFTEDVRKKKIEYIAADTFGNSLYIENNPIYFVWKHNKSSNTLPAAETQYPYLSHYKYIDIASGGGLPKKFHLKIGDVEQEYELKNNDELIKCSITINGSNYEIGIRLNIEKDSWVLYENKNEDFQLIEKSTWVTQSGARQSLFSNNDREVNIYLAGIQYIKNLSANTTIFSNEVKEEEAQRMAGIQKQQQRLDLKLKEAEDAKSILIKNYRKKSRAERKLSDLENEQIWNDGQKSYFQIKNTTQTLKRITNSIKNQFNKISNNIENIKNHLSNIETFIQKTEKDAKDFLSLLDDGPISEKSEIIIIKHNTALEKLEEAKEALKIAENTPNLDELEEAVIRTKKAASEAREAANETSEAANIGTSNNKAKNSLPFIQNAQNAAKEADEYAQKAETILIRIKSSQILEEIDEKKEDIHINFNKAKVAYKTAITAESLSKLNEFIRIGEEASKVAREAWRILMAKASEIPDNEDAKKIIDIIQKFDQEVNDDYRKAQEVLDEFILKILNEIKIQQKLIQLKENKAKALYKTSKNRKDLDEIQKAIDFISEASKAAEESRDIVNAKANEIPDNQEVKNITNNVQELVQNINVYSIEAQAILTKLKEIQTFNEIIALHQTVQSSLTYIKDKYEASQGIQNLIDARIINNILKAAKDAQIKTDLSKDKAATIPSNEAAQNLAIAIAKSFEEIKEYVQKFQEIVTKIEAMIFKEIEDFQKHVSAKLQEIQTNCQFIKTTENLDAIKEHINIIEIVYADLIKTASNAINKAQEINNYPGLEDVINNISNSVEKAKQDLKSAKYILNSRESENFIIKVLTEMYNKFNEVIEFGIFNSLLSLGSWINDQCCAIMASWMSESKQECNEYIKKFNQIEAIAQEAESFAMSKANEFPNNEEIQKEVQEFINLIYEAKKNIEKAKFDIIALETKTESELLKEIKELKNRAAQQVVDIELYTIRLQKAKELKNINKMEETVNLIKNSFKIAQDAEKIAFIKASKILCNTGQANREVADIQYFVQEAATHTKQAEAYLNEYKEQLNYNLENTESSQSKDGQKEKYKTKSSSVNPKKKNDHKKSNREKEEAHRDIKKEEKEPETFFHKIINFFKKLFS